MNRTKSESNRNQASQSTRPNESRRKTTSPNTRSDPIASLHQLIGNQTIRRLHENKGLQTKLKLNYSNDGYEQEAKRVAQQMTVTPESTDRSKERGDDRTENDTLHTSTIQRLIPTYRTASQSGSTVSEADNTEFGQSLRDGKPLSDETRLFFEHRFGHDFGDVRVHTGTEATEATRSVNAIAFTHGTNIVFRRGEYEPGNTQGKRLLAHELTHVVQQRNSTASGDSSIPTLQRQDAIGGTSGQKIGKETSLVMVNESTGEEFEVRWIAMGTGTNYYVPELRLGGGLKFLREQAAEKGYVIRVNFSEKTTASKSTAVEQTKTEAKETVTDAAPTKPSLLSKAQKVMSISQAMYVLHLARIANARDMLDPFRAQPWGFVRDPLFDADEQKTIGDAIEFVKRYPRYEVNERTYRVTLSKPKDGKREIKSIHDFILFVEAVERQYPSASAQDIVSELRQMWFADQNWSVMVAGEGITNTTEDGQTEYVDLESATNPMASEWDILNLTSKEWEKIHTFTDSFGITERVETTERMTRKTTFDTPMGEVRISHLLAGIDAVLSGSPASYPKQFLQSRGEHEFDAELKYKTLQKQSGGDVSDFATWSGDLAQAYTNYLVDRWVNENESASLQKHVEEYAPLAELRADIHGYVAVEVYRASTATKRPGGARVSDILRTLYLREESDKPAFERQVTTVAKQAAGSGWSSLGEYVTERAMRFAAPWFAKLMRRDATLTLWWNTPDITLTEEKKKKALAYGMSEFERLHEKNEKNADPKNKLSTLVDDFLEQMK